jgi:hypothetical protein
MRRRLPFTCIGACLLLLAPSVLFGQFPNSVICQFERIATAELDANGKIASGADKDTGELVISDLNTDRPLASGNIGSVKLEVLRRSESAIWLAAHRDDSLLSEGSGVVTLFSKSRVAMYTKHEILHTADGDMPFGFVEIGKFRPLK